MVIISVCLVIFIVIVDQITKNAVLSHIGIGGKPVTVVERFFYIVCHRNSGAAFGILKDGRAFFLVLTSVLLVIMFIFIVKSNDAFLRISVAFVMGGAIGNYIDRLFVGSVVDFLDFYIFGYNFPTFNAADSSIVLGAALLIIYSFKKSGVVDKGASFEQSGGAGDADSQ